MRSGRVGKRWRRQRRPRLGRHGQRWRRTEVDEAVRVVAGRRNRRVLRQQQVVRSPDGHLGWDGWAVSSRPRLIERDPPIERVGAP
jgi:hypothetical protein